MKAGTIMISSRALVLYEIIRGIDDDIQKALQAGEDVTELRAERKRRADECQYYLERATVVKRTRKHHSKQR